MKVMTLVGTRPEIIKLSCVIPALDRAVKHVLVHTGQNYDERLNDLFFQELGVRRPDVNLEVQAECFGDQVGQILARIEPVLMQHQPDRVLILGDTNSGLSAIVARRHGIPVFHMEAGNRCYDDRVPEEINRRIIDHVSTILMPYTHRSRENLLREGIPGPRIHVTGNPIKEVIDHYAERIAASNVLTDLGLTARQFFLVTMHRAENVDIEERLNNLVRALASLHQAHGFPVICSLHPRTRAKAAAFGIPLEGSGVHYLKPLGFFDFIRLEQAAFCLLSDSGTVQEEGCIFGVPNVTIRDVTERPETVDCGSNVLAGSDPERILRLVKFVTSRANTWQPPPEYMVPHVAATVGRILLGYSLSELRVG